MLRMVQVLFLLAIASGCTERQVYDSGQAWQRNECGKIADRDRQDRCLREASTSYENYKRQIDAEKSR